MVSEKTIYTTSDGKTFEDKQEAEKYEKKLQQKSIKIYKVHYSPDLNEGRGYYNNGYVYIHANREHELFLRHFLCEKFGNPISFVMGVFGSNAIMPSYSYIECSEKDVIPDKILAKIEENFVDKLWNHENE